MTVEKSIPKRHIVLTMTIPGLIVASLIAPAPRVVLNEIPFKLAESAIIIDVEVNGCRASLMYDTGFSGTVVASENLDLGKATGTMTLVDFVGSFEAKTVKVKTMKIGGVTFDSKDLEVVQQPPSHYTLSYGMHCDGILGLEPFKGKLFQINFEKQKIIVFNNDYDISTKQLDPTKAFIAKLLPIGMSSLELTVTTEKGEKLFMALDTGNGGYATTHKESLVRTGLWPESQKAKYMSQSFVASGPVDTFYARMKNMKIYNVPVPECVFSVIDLPSSSADKDGTVGFEFLKNFNITIDMTRRKVLLENFSGKYVEPEIGQTGFYALPDERLNRMRVVFVTPDSPAEKAGIKYGDHLLSVDSKDVSHLSRRQVQTLLEGAPNSKVNLDMSRNGNLVRIELERKVLVN